MKTWRLLLGLGFAVLQIGCDRSPDAASLKHDEQRLAGEYLREVQSILVRRNPSHHVYQPDSDSLMLISLGVIEMIPNENLKNGMPVTLCRRYDAETAKFEVRLRSFGVVTPVNQREYSHSATMTLQLEIALNIRENMPGGRITFVLPEDWETRTAEAQKFFLRQYENKLLPPAFDFCKIFEKSGRRQTISRERVLLLRYHRKHCRWEHQDLSRHWLKIDAPDWSSAKNGESARRGLMSAKGLIFYKGMWTDPKSQVYFDHFDRGMVRWNGEWVSRAVRGDSEALSQALARLGGESSHWQMRHLRALVSALSQYPAAQQRSLWVVWLERTLSQKLEDCRREEMDRMIDGWETVIRQIEERKLFDVSNLLSQSRQCRAAIAEQRRQRQEANQRRSREAMLKIRRERIAQLKRQLPPLSDDCYSNMHEIERTVRSFREVCMGLSRPEQEQLLTDILSCRYNMRMTPAAQTLSLLEPTVEREIHRLFPRSESEEQKDLALRAARYYPSPKIGDVIELRYLRGSESRVARGKFYGYGDRNKTVKVGFQYIPVVDIDAKQYQALSHPELNEKLRRDFIREGLQNYAGRMRHTRERILFERMTRLGYFPDEATGKYMSPREWAVRGL